MLTHEAIQEIRDRGYSINDDWLRNSIRRGKLKKPRVDASLRYDWTQADIDHVCEVLGQKELKLTDQEKPPVVEWAENVEPGDYTIINSSGTAVGVIRRVG